MGRAFVGLADEATAAYNNPAGLSVLAAPEFSFEYRNTSTNYEFLQNNGQFELLNGSPQPFVANLDRLGFASLSFSLPRFNVSVYYINHLDYQRSTGGPEISRWRNLDQGYEFNYTNDHRVKMGLDTFGVSISKSWGRLSLGCGIGFSEFSLDYEYDTRLFSDFLSQPLFEVVLSNAESKSRKPNYVAGALFDLTDDMKVGLVYKRQPKFSYREFVNNPQFPPDRFPDGEPFSIGFKVPDSVNTGLAYQPNGLLTVLVDLDWIRYSQLNDDFTIISGENFESLNYRIPDVVETHIGFEYLIPFESQILALRAGWFTDPDHKTRFDGALDVERDQIQDFIFNTGNGDDNQAITFGFGYVWRNRFQFDVAVIQSDRFDWLVTSFLYRF